MSGFDGDWLKLRAPHDDRARDPGLVERLAAWVRRRVEGTEGRLIVADLGSGTGSTVRALQARLPAPQAWRLIEHDAALIERGREELAPLPGVRVDWRQHDLAKDPEAALPDRVDLITASAFLDLVSAGWLERLAALAQRENAALYVALTYHGRQRWRPGDPFDSRALELFNAHQRGVKGFGPALGPDAADALAASLPSASGELYEASSPWKLDHADGAIQSAILDGWRRAAAEIAADDGERREVEDWAAQRSLRIGQGRSTLEVGHRDQLWLPRT